MNTPKNGLLRDERVHCFSLMSTMTVQNYLSFVEPAYHTRGGLRGQREPLKTTTARRIRQRMISDIVKGALLPPIVIGVVIGDESKLNILSNSTDVEILDLLAKDLVSHISIIDGMQRTTALLDAIAEAEAVKNHLVRVEIWFSQSTDNLIYRMLVLNTGQVPWNIKHQLQVVYAPLIDEMSRKVKFVRLISLPSGGRRTKGGEFSADNLVEAYLAFGLRRLEIDTQETLADEFSRLDIAESLVLDKYNKFFYPIAQAMVDLDKSFSRFDDSDAESKEETETTKFTIGRNIFDSQPARIGFVVACSLYVLGRIGMDRTVEDSEAALNSLSSGVGNLTAQLQSLEMDALKEFLSLEILSEKIKSVKRSAIGRNDRVFFEKAFKVLIEEDFNVPNLGVCWRA
ncbi:hypothetical protein [Undibacterium sp. TS12]|uniref:hypothetical protein n=1 Tax=Undibacterium sp. TS12 TaxID=2908202 RepID=UPI001F4CDD4B|nr:hypothetical protein [Undibacterium sp. TS12]MCH8620753.1 hypothetical protein [Undibacterium sp. TS12]